MGRLGKTIAPVFEPVGIDWRGSVSLLTGLVAKEIVVSTMGVLYATKDDKGTGSLSKALLSSGMTQLSAFCFMVFVLLYVPCLATVATIKRETNSLKWALFSISYSIVVAWVVSFIIYQGGKIVGQL
mmetsp:Transcript_26888/g.12585  ORF Transcript_26888/g.12585 Transcript_26888/m.12585 type:complete len:127 (-) Transcript_26888:164-544(-)